MPKMKSHGGAKKRFTRTASGKWKFKHAGKRHLLTPNSGNKVRRMRKAGILNDVDGKTISRFLPYH